MDVLLVNAGPKEITEHVRLSLPLGLAYIGAVLRNAGYDVSAIDLNVMPMNNAQIIQLIEKTSPRMVAISACTPTYLSGLNFARLVKKIHPETKVVIGGPHASVLYKEASSEDCIDIVVIGEGEYTALELANHLANKDGNLSEVKGIAYKDDGRIRVTDRRAPITNPDDLPFPARDLFPFDLYGIPNAVLASRGGCPYACPFCAVNNIWGGRRCYRKPEKVVEEILDTINKFGPEQAGRVSFSDDVLTYKREYIMHLCHLIRQYRSLNPFVWRCTTRVDLVDAEILQEMRYAGCCQISYGIEAGSQKILDSIDKKITLDQIKKAVDMTLNLGMDAACSFMFPHPEDTEDTIKEQTQFMRELYEMGASEVLAMTTPLPGTYFYDNADKLGIKILSNNWDEYDCRRIIIATKNFSKEQLQALHSKLVQDLGMLSS